MSELLTVKNLKTQFNTEGGVVQAVDGISYHIDEQEIIGLVGESGCGKTTIGRCILRLYQPTGGQILFEGEDISSFPEQKIRHIRHKMAVIF